MRFDSDVQEGKLSLEDIMAKMMEITEHQISQEKSFNKSYEHLSEKLDDNTKAMKDQTASMEHCLKIIDDLMEENKRLNKRVVELERKVDDMEQYSRLNAVEIHGVPMEPNEDAVEVVKEVGKALDMVINESMIDACHRLGRRPGPNNSPPAIIVKFVRRLDKEEFMKRRRVKRNLSTRHMNLKMDQPVYVNEALSQGRRRLLGAAREVKREKKWKYLWVRGGKIFLRKEEGSTVVQVTCQADLDRL